MAIGIHLQFGCSNVSGQLLGGARAVRTHLKQRSGIREDEVRAVRIPRRVPGKTGEVIRDVRQFTGFEVKYIDIGVRVKSQFGAIWGNRRLRGGKTKIGNLFQVAAIWVHYPNFVVPPLCST